MQALVLRFIGALFAGLVLLSLYMQPCSAQVSANLSGRITDPSGAEVSGANVTATNLATGVSRTAATNPAGRYQVSEIPLGEYEIHVSKEGFAEAVRSGV